MRIPLNPSPRVGIRTCSDYSPFGVELDGRTVSNYGYRFGYQGSEKDNEFKGDGNSYTTEFRQLDPRLGRWLSVDPVIQPWQSTYCAMDDNPLFFYDKKGDSSVWDKKGYMIHYDPNDKDLRAYMLNKGKLKYIGTLGGEIKADIWFKNLLKPLNLMFNNMEFGITNMQARQIRIQTLNSTFWASLFTERIKLMVLVISPIHISFLMEKREEPKI
jgi:RHS repeat-associated protein